MRRLTIGTSSPSSQMTGLSPSAPWSCKLQVGVITRHLDQRAAEGCVCKLRLRNFLDQTGWLWVNGALVGKVGSVFASAASEHGGQETTLVSFHTTLLHHGMIVVGVPYSEPRLTNIAEITGGTPYGATTLALMAHASRPKMSSPSPPFRVGMSRRPTH